MHTGGCAGDVFRAVEIGDTLERSRSLGGLFVFRPVVNHAPNRIFVQSTRLHVANRHFCKCKNRGVVNFQINCTDFKSSKKFLGLLDFFRIFGFFLDFINFFGFFSDFFLDFFSGFFSGFFGFYDGFMNKK